MVSPEKRGRRRWTSQDGAASSRRTLQPGRCVAGGRIDHHFAPPCRPHQDRMPGTTGQRDCADHDQPERNVLANNLLSVQLGVAVCERKRAAGPGGGADVRSAADGSSSLHRRGCDPRPEWTDDSIHSESRYREGALYRGGLGRYAADESGEFARPDGERFEGGEQLRCAAKSKAAGLRQTCFWQRPDDIRGAAAVVHAGAMGLAISGLSPMFAANSAVRLSKSL